MKNEDAYKDDIYKDTVLIVDDVILNREVLVATLRGKYKTDEAENSLVALEKIKKCPSDYSAVIVDLGISCPDGFSFMEELKNDSAISRIPVIFVSEYNDVKGQIKALECGAVDVISKPFNPDIVICRVNNIISRRAAEQQASELRLYERLLTQAEIDEKTGMYNKMAFCRKTSQIIAARKNKSHIIIRWDIDRFKVYNDMFGVEEGDKLLEAVGKAYTANSVGNVLISGHLDADHFVSCYDENDFDADAILETLDDVLSKHNPGFGFTVRMGLYKVEDITLDVSLMCDRALLALRSLKNDYRKRYAFYDESMRNMLLREQNMIDEIDRAIADKQFIIYLQPQVNYSENTIIGAEALVRWQHPEKGIILPGKFIPLFEKNGYIRKLDEYVWEQVCVYQRSRIDRGMPEIPISVNMSRHDILFSHPGEVFCALIKKYRLSPSLIHIEVTESVFMQDQKKLIDMIDDLKAEGFIIEMDDFGSGYSSLNTLKELYVDKLKLDMRFLESGRDSSRAGSILSSVVRMAHWLNLSVIAEGVETAEMAEYLNSLGCVEMQGYYFGRPMPIPEFEHYVSNVNTNSALLYENRSKDEGTVDFLNASTQATLMFNSFIGSAQIVELEGSSIEVLRANDEYFRMSEQTREEFGKYSNHIQDSFCPESRDAFIDSLHEAKKTGEEQRVQLEALPKNRNDRKFWTEVRIRHLASRGTRDLFYLSIEDITGRKEYDKMHDSLDDIIHNVPNGFGVYEYKNNEIYPVFVSDRVCELFGVSRLEYDNRVKRGLPSEYVSGSTLFSGKTLRSDDEAGKTVRVKRRDGSFFWLNIIYHIVIRKNKNPFIYATLLDVTDQVKADEEFKLEKLKTEYAAQNAKITITEYSITDKHRKIIGSYKNNIIPDEMDNVPESIIEGGYIAPESVEEYRKFYSAVQSGEENSSCVVRIKVSSGDFESFRLSYKVLYTDDKPVSAIGWNHNITEEIKALTRSRELEMAIDATSIYFWTFDIINNTYPIVNKNAQKLGIGSIENGKQIGILDGDMLLPDGKEALIKAHNALLSVDNVKDKVSVVCHMNRKKSGMEWMRITTALNRDVKGSIISFSLIGEDCTDSEEAEILYSNALSGNTGEAGVNAYASVLADLDDDIVELGKSFIAKTGYSYAQSVNDLIQFVYSDADKERVARALSRRTLIDSFKAGIKTINIVYRRLFENETVPHYVRTTVKSFIQSKTGHIKSLHYSVDIDREQLSRVIGRIVLRKNFEMVGVIYAEIDALHCYNLSEYEKNLGIGIDSRYSDNLNRFIDAYIKPENRISAKAEMSIENFKKQLETSDISGVILPMEINGEKYYKLWRYAYADDEKSTIMVGRSDVTDIQNIKERNEELNRLLSGMKTSVAHYDIRNCTLSVSPEYAMIFGIPTVIENVPYGADMSVITDMDGYVKFYERILRGEKSGDAELQFMLRDGTPHWEHASFSTIFDNYGTPVSAVITTIDITKQRILEIEAERNRVILERNGISIFDYDVRSDILNYETIRNGRGRVIRQIKNFKGNGEYKKLIAEESQDDFLSLIERISKEREKGTFDFAIKTPLGVRKSRLFYATVTDTNESVYRAVGQITELKEKNTVLNNEAQDVDSVIKDGGEDTNSEAESGIKIREDMKHSIDEMSAAIRQSGKTAIRYDIENDRAESLLSGEVILGVAPIIENYSRTLVERGMIAPESLEAHNAFIRAMRSGMPGGDYSILVNLPEKAKAWINVKYSLMYDENHKPVYAIISMFDNTDYMEKEIAYQKWRENLNGLLKNNMPYLEVNLSRDLIERSENLINPEYVGSDNKFSGFVDKTEANIICREDKSNFGRFLNCSRLLASYMGGVHSDMLEYRITQNGLQKWFRIETEMVKYPYNHDIKAYISFTDIDRDVREKALLSRYATTDSLTGLLNRKTFAESVDTVLKNATCGEHFALCILDIDDFKLVNDNFGHIAGDKVLIKFAVKLKTAIGKGNLVGRIGGDEFMAFISYKCDNDVDRIAKSLLINQRDRFKGKQISMSLGIALSSQGCGFERLYDIADKALYIAKENGKNRYHISNKD